MLNTWMGDCLVTLAASSSLGISKLLSGKCLASNSRPQIEVVYLSGHLSLKHPKEHNQNFQRRLIGSLHHLVAVLVPGEKLLVFYFCRAIFF